MAHLLNIETSPRGARSASIRVAEHFIDEVRKLHPETTVDTLNVWTENLPEFDAEAIGAKYHGTADEPLQGAEAAIWQRIESLAARFQKADHIVLGVPMWNFSIPYKLKQLIDLACQRNLLFTFDGTRFGPKLSGTRAFVVFAQGQHYPMDGPTPASTYDYQTPYIHFWLSFIGVQEVMHITVADTWTDQEQKHVEAACEQARALAREF